MKEHRQSGSRERERREVSVEEERNEGRKNERTDGVG
jgi:hypothetical protein